MKIKDTWTKGKAIEICREVFALGQTAIIGEVLEYENYKIEEWINEKLLDKVSESYLEFHMNNGEILKIDISIKEFKEKDAIYADSQLVEFIDISGNKVLVKLSSISHIVQR